MYNTSHYHMLINDVRVEEIAFSPTTKLINSIRHTGYQQIYDTILYIHSNVIEMAL